MILRQVDWYVLCSTGRSAPPFTRHGHAVWSVATKAFSTVHFLTNPLTPNHGWRAEPKRCPGRPRGAHTARAAGPVIPEGAA